MVAVQLNRHDYEYDIHSLVKAFYPKEDVTVCFGEVPADAGEIVAVDLTGPELSFKEGEDRFQKLSHYDGISVQVGPLSDYEKLSPKADRTETKNTLKSLLYRLLCTYTGKELPWGNLTGIRPTKIAMGLLKEGFSEDGASRYMQEIFYTSASKANLAVRIAKRERKILKDLPGQDGYSLYVGIPFCPSICLYCSFSSSPLSLWENRVDEYLDALCREIEETCDTFADKKLTAVYIGGGTPTTLSPAQLTRLLTKLESAFDFRHVKEFTVEAGRPDTITAEKLKVLREHPVTRISINPQTMNQKTLDVIGRKHTVEDTIEAFELARSFGFSNINMDLIVGLPGEGLAEVEHTMEEIGKLSPESVTVHSLALKRATRLHLFQAQYQDISFQNSSQIMELTEESCKRMGLEPYYLYRQKNMAGNFENVGYAKEGKACLYNILIMEEVQSILAVGAGASTKLVAGERIERVENVKDIKNYLERIGEMIERKKRIPKRIKEMESCAPA